MYPYDFIPKQRAINFTEIFVVMPFKKKHNAIYSKLIVPATKMANEKLGFSAKQKLKPYRTKEDTKTVSGWINVLEHLLTAQIVIGVLTDDNPNVFYELGIAHAKEPITRQILIANKGYSPRFDIKDLIYYAYEDKLEDSVEALADKIKDAIDSYKIAQERKIAQAKMLIGPYEFEVVMLHSRARSFVLHTSREGRINYEQGLRNVQQTEYVDGAFERHVMAIGHLCQCGLLGLDTSSNQKENQIVVSFSYHWTELGNLVLHQMRLIPFDEVKNRREVLPAHFNE